MKPWVLALALGTGPVGSAVAQSPTDDRLPHVAGFELTDSAGPVRTALGSPEREQRLMGFVVWDYDHRGLTVMWDREDGTLRVVILHKRGAGDVEGVRVGDPRARAASRWGIPTRRRQSGRFLDFVRRGWAISVEVARDRIVEITLTVAPGGER